MVGKLKTLRPDEQEMEMTEEMRRIYKEVFTDKGVLTYSISTDITIYEEIQNNHAKLTTTIPTFYDYEINTEQSRRWSFSIINREKG